MKRIAKEYGWIGICIVFLLMLWMMYQIVDQVDAATIKATPDDVELEKYYDDLENLALCVQAECGNVKEESCIRATTDTIINRYDDPRFPNSFYGVFSEAGQFSTFKYYFSINPNDRVYRICREQLEFYWEHGETQHPNVFYFRTKHYHNFGTPMFQAGPHFFSGF